jgi:exopolysaccharide production protein ExoY
MNNDNYPHSYDAGSVAPPFLAENFEVDDEGSFSLVYARRWKRSLDVGMVLVAAPFLLPIMLVIAVLLKLRGGPAMYSQPRIGRKGEVFRFWKFRTMVPDADEKLAAYLALNPDAAREWERDQKLSHDPRITPLGKILRKTSLDELPQLWNVLVGDMSLVGPRPFMPEQQQLYPGLDQYFAVRPGLTGLWQVSERNDVSFRQRAEMDRVYAGSISFASDVHIIAQTFAVVVRATGR